MATTRKGKVATNAPLEDDAPLEDIDRFLQQNLKVAQRLGPDDLIRLRRDSDWRVRHCVANRINLNDLSAMDGDADPLVREVVLKRLIGK